MSFASAWEHFRHNRNLRLWHYALETETGWIGKTAVVQEVLGIVQQMNKKVSKIHTRSRLGKKYSEGFDSTDILTSIATLKADVQVFMKILDDEKKAIKESSFNPIKGQVMLEDELDKQLLLLSQMRNLLEPLKAQFQSGEYERICSILISLHGNIIHVRNHSKVALRAARNLGLAS